ncbi:hypothetical protein [Pyrodictium occultum]|uniref:hypothetical protein n=1 Tax=Pyrodictium occultum TaxID=2309 RepID=UPI0014430C4D|nr:hypothetical protein [Pyrodictium occultum]
MELFNIVLVLILVALGIAPSLRRLLLTIIALLHVAYVKAYISTYGLQLALKPGLDVFVDRRGHASAMLDLAQLSAAGLLVDLLYERYLRARRRTININPQEPS